MAAKAHRSITRDELLALAEKGASFEEI